MSDGLHLGDEVEVITDAFAALGAPLGAIGVIVDDWADGSNDVEVSDPKTGEVIARFRAAEGEILPHERTAPVAERREHGLIFGRGDDLGAPSGDPASLMSSEIAGTGGIRREWPVDQSSPEYEELTDEVPWELQEPPQTGPVLI